MQPTPARLREKLHIDQDLYQKLVAYEEVLHQHQGTLQIINEVTELYTRLIEYFEYAKDPVKFYFQEKAANLFNRKEIVKAFLGEGNKANNAKEPVELLGNSFLNFSELRDAQESNSQFALQSFNKPTPKSPPISTLVSEKHILDAYQKDQMSKKIDMIMMMKVNDQMLSNAPNQDSMSHRLVNFEKNDSLISSHLESQTSAVNNRLAQRKMQSRLRSSVKRL